MINILIPLHQVGTFNHVCLSTLSLFSDLSFFNSSTPLFFLIFHKNSPLFTLSIRELQVHISTTSIAFAKKRNSPLQLRLSFSFISIIPRSRLPANSATPSSCIQFFNDNFFIYSSPILPPLQPFLSHPPEQNSRRNDLFYYLLSAYLFFRYICKLSLLFFILTELKPKLELISEDVNDLPFTGSSRANPERGRHPRLLLAYSLRHNF